MLSSISLSAVAAHAQNATWTGGGAPDANEWRQDNNWTSPATIPTGTAIFDTGGTTPIHNDAGGVAIGAISFVNAAAYTINVDDLFVVNGTGVANNSSAVIGQIFNVNPAGNPIGSGTLLFQNGASANTGTGIVTYNNFGGGFISFLNTSNAGNANTTINNNSILQFFDTSSGNAAHINNHAITDFFDSSSAGNATITNTAGAALSFNNSASAGTATISTGLSSFATITFNGLSTAAASHIDLVDGILTFNNSSKAGSAIITMSSLTHPGSITFNNTSSAENATITNVSITGLADGVRFLDQSTAGNATITNNTNNSIPGGGGELYFGSLGGTDTANAGTAHITNNNQGSTSFLAHTSALNASIQNNSGGNLNFQDQSTAGNATISNNAGGTINFGVPLGVGTDTADAGTANITNNGGTINFNASTTALNAFITTLAGGHVFFFDSATGGNARFVTDAGGVFDASGLTASSLTAGSIEGAGSYILGNKLLTTGSNNLSTAVFGVISGVGGQLTKVGTGTMVLSNTNTYTGATNVNGGTLEVDGSIATSSLTTVNSGGTLTGTGIVGNTTVASGGIFQPGNATPGSSMTVTGNLGFAAGALYGIVVNPTTASFATVSGQATLGGATVDATFAPGSYISKQYTILTFGSRVGSFGNLVNFSLPSGFVDSLSYDATHAYLNLTMLFVPPSGGFNTNQQNIANALLNSFNTVGGIPIAFTGLTAGQLSQLSGEVGAGFAQGAFQAGNSFLNLMLNPFINGRFGGGGFGVMGYAEEPRKKSAATDAFASVKPKQAPSFDERYSIWGSAFGGSGSINGNATTGSHDTKTQNYGFAAGLDYKLTPNSLLGFALAGGGTHWSLSQGLGSGRSDMFQAGVYGMTRWGAAYLSAAAAYSFHDVSTSRTVTIAGTDTLGAGFRANAFGGRLEGGYRLAAPWFGITPYGAVQVQSVALPAYGEAATSGSNQFALNYSSQTVTTTRTELGARFDKSWLLDQGAALTFYSRAAWAHDSGNTRSASAIFQALPASNFTVNAAQPTPDSALVTAGAEYKMANGWSVLAKFDGEFSKTTSLYSGAGELRKAW